MPIIQFTIFFRKLSLTPDIETQSELGAVHHVSLKTSVVRATSGCLSVYLKERWSLMLLLALPVNPLAVQMTTYLKCSSVLFPPVHRHHISVPSSTHAAPNPP